MSPLHYPVVYSGRVVRAGDAEQLRANRTRPWDPLPPPLWTRILAGEPPNQVLLVRLGEGAEEAVEAPDQL